MKRIITLLSILYLLMCLPLSSIANDFMLITKDKALQVYIDPKEKEVVQTSRDIFFSDVELVSGIKAKLQSPGNSFSVVAGTIGTNKYIDELISRKLIQADGLKDQWEAFRIQIITDNNKDILVVAGSDSRGTAYGILELSRLIGVSPWVWWADALPDKKDEVSLKRDYYTQQQPSVQYRGIFLNDEDWGLMPWSSKNYEQTSRKGQIGPKTYARIFELLLRLRANTLWPAMHESTVPFYFVEGNKEMADKYGIVLGTSHCEPLMRNGAGEWDNKKYGEYNYLTNKETINQYWGERLQEAGKYENFYTIGMRGVHDGKMEGVKTLDEQTSVLQDVIDNQRQLLTKYVGKDASSIPQAFIPYKEVLSVYENGLKLPDDVTLVWCDDNYGYLTRLSNTEEQKRKGGGGVYYHISYWGRPHDYLWLSTTQPSLIYYQMQNAWKHNVRKLWILNVGDIKPAEYDMEFFLDMAWNINSIDDSNIYQHMDTWLTREFGKALSPQLSFVMKEYFRLASIRRPEFMGWSRVEEYSVKGGKTPVIDTEFNPFMFGDEIEQRIADYDRITDIINQLGEEIPDNRKSAYFQLMTYPVNAAAEMNKKLLYAQKARLFAKHNLPDANLYALQSNNAYNEITALTMAYNRDMAKMKWDGMMDMKPRKLAVFERAPLPDRVDIANSGKASVWIEGEEQPRTAGATINLQPLVKHAKDSTFVILLQQGNQPVEWTFNTSLNWLNAKEVATNELNLKRLVLSINWDNVTKDRVSGECSLSINGEIYNFVLTAINNNITKGMESDRMIAMNAVDYSLSPKQARPIQGLGHSLNAMVIPVGEKYFVEYTIYTTSMGEAVIRTALIPNHPIEGKDLRYAIAVDNEKPQIVSLATEFRSEPWKINVLRNQTVKETIHNITKPGKHTIRIYALDEGVVLDQIMVDFDKDRKFYQIPVSKQ
ncbi:glycosyl hydrolase 115 family protein [Dysgonomonas macrotermitis]|uniref:Glycosyl hydrolase family 115 n=1 Tax=Dysgonomonas macrotermitis TaxID=1346286 RepID=A0A1M4TJX1_9BACT|nr:glycosyl hydrolase 115 family protein [Dysgonomonas macrotermitis]SHE44760.1 Glycosyl hydrolase family 115 [Dysgonomonas macrotermitis]